MRKISSILLLLSSLSVTAQKIAFGVIAPFHLTDLSGKNIEWVGDSYIAGNNASPAATNRFSRKVADYYGANEVNKGVTGRAMQGNGCSGGVLDRTIISPYVDGLDGLLIIALGTNDAGENNGVSDTSHFRMKYDSVLDYAINTQHWPIKRIMLFTPYYVTNYNSWVGFGTCNVTVAATEQRFLDYLDRVNKIGAYWNVRVFDIYNYVKPIAGSILDTDGLHPTNSGHANIAAKIETVL